MDLLRKLLLNGKYFLLSTSLKQVLGSSDQLEHKALRNLNSLIIATVVYSLWRERNSRIF